MGSGASRHRLLRFPCFNPTTTGEDTHLNFEPGPLDETLGHSFCYVRSSSPAHSLSSSSSSDEPPFTSISGASVSANSSAAATTTLLHPLPIYDSATGFRSSSSFSALPLQLSSGPLDRGFFLSGPIERGPASGPLDTFSGPLVKRKKPRGISGRIRSLSEKNRHWVVPLRPRCDPDDDAPPIDGGVQWAHGKAGEDRVHVVVSEDHRWLFVGIYDGFNGADAPEFLVGNLYRSVFSELQGLFWEELEEEEVVEDAVEDFKIARPLWEFLDDDDGDDGGELNFSGSGRFVFSLSKLRYGFGSWRKEKPKVIQEVAGRSSCRRRKVGRVADHELVLRALSRALELTEIAYLEMVDKAMDCNPELALMGSCLLVVLMRDDDVYVMNLGDSRAIVAQSRTEEVERRNVVNGLDLEEGTVKELEADALWREAMELGALQLSVDHSTSIQEEVLRIKEEHPDDSQCIVNGRVKGRLKVTRAFGAGFLKQPKWNNSLLEMFRNEYIGTAPYISCSPSLCHHKLRPSDKFLVISSDGLYQYLSNEEVVSHVQNFVEKFPDGDPAQSLIEELLSRAAKKAGMDFHELLDIPQGDRRKYHDDVTVMIISLEGRIWKSSGKYL